MLEISILRVENPSCMWGRIVSDVPQNTAKYAHLQVEMNLFYHDVKLQGQKLKPASVEESQVCVVYWSAARNWCRAIVESVNLKNTDQTHATCFLLDHGTHVTVKHDEIRTVVEKFLHLPFWVKKFHLAGLHPTTLQVSFEGKAELVPTSQWDMSATRYLHNLLQASSRTEAVLLEPQADSTAIELYLTTKNTTICVNGELVAKKFAYYKAAAQNGAGSQAMDGSPVFLTHDIFCDRPALPPVAPTTQRYRR